MIVKCIANRINFIDGLTKLGRELRESTGVGNHQLDITIGRFYVVYGVALRQTGPWYFISDDLYNYTSYPIAYPSALFELLDEKSSVCWLNKYQAKEIKNLQTKADVLYTFTEWSNNDMFYEHLVNGDNEVLSVFNQKKLFMDMEFPNPSCNTRAKILGEGWVQCIQCENAWELKSCLGMLKCPKCHTILLNPVYLEKDKSI